MSASCGAEMIRCRSATPACCTYCVDDVDRRLDVVQLALVDAHALAGQAGVGEADLDQLDGVPLSAASAARTLAATVSVSTMASDAGRAGLAPPEDRLVDPRVHVGQQDVVEHALPALREPLAERLLDRRRSSRRSASGSGLGVIVPHFTNAIGAFLSIASVACIPAGMSLNSTTAMAGCVFIT